jgi:hypothetical protein
MAGLGVLGAGGFVSPEFDRLRDRLGTAGRRAYRRAGFLFLRRISEMLNEDVRARKDLGFVTVLPAHEVWRRSILAQHLQDLAVTLLLPLVVPPHDQAIPGACAQG